MSTGLENDLLGDAFAVDDTPEEQEEQAEERLYDFYAGNEGVESAADGTSYLWNQEGYSQATEADLREYFDSAVNLQDTFGDFETYLAYMNERQDLIDSGEYSVGDYGQLVETGGLSYQDPWGFEISADDYNNLSPNDFMAKYGVDKSEVEVIQADTTTGRKDGYNEWLNSDPVQALNAKYGIDNVRRTDDGREYMWNGSGWVKTFEPENFDLGSALKLVGAAGMGALLTPAIAGALGPVLGATASKAAASAIVSSALGLAQGQDVSLEDALRSAMMPVLQEYLSFDGVSQLLSDLGIEGSTPEWLTDILDKGEEFLGQVEELISTGIEPIDAMIQAGGKDVLEQLVTTGEIDPQQALISMAQTGMVEGVEWLMENYGDQFFGAERQYHMLDEDGNVVYTFEDAETAIAWADNTGAGGQYNDSGLILGWSDVEPNEFLEFFMEGGGGAALEGAAAVIGAAQDMGWIPTVNPDVGSQRYEYVGEGKFRDVTTGEVWTVENTDGLIPGMTVSDDWMAANDAQNTDEVWMDDGIDNDYTDVIDDIVDNVDDTRDEVVDDTTEVVDDVTDEVVEEVVEPIEEVIEVHEDFVNPQDKVTDLLNNMQGQVSGITDSETDNETDATADGTENDGDATEGGDNDGTQGNGQSGNGEDGDGDDGTGAGPGGDGIGIGAGSGGLLSGGAFEPKVTDLFKYTRLTPYQKKALEPLKHQISTAKGMLS